jgi:hypothetical protein
MEAVHVGPFDQAASDAGAQPKFDEDQVPIPAPMVDIATQVRKAIPEAFELCLCGLDPDHARHEWLHKNHIGMQEFR